MAKKGGLLTVERRYRYYLDRIFRLLESEQWTIEIRRMPKHDGWCFFEEKKIVIDPRSHFIKILIHECLHANHRQMTHGRIYYLIGKIINQASTKQIKRLLESSARLIQ